MSDIAQVIASNVGSRFIFYKGVNLESSALTAAGSDGGTAIWTKRSAKRSTSFRVNTVEVHLQHMGIKNGNTAAALVISPTATERWVRLMRSEYRTRLEQYLSSMLQAKKLLVMGVLTHQDCATIDTMLAEKYGIASCSLYRGIDLLCCENNGNMSNHKEVE